MDGIADDRMSRCQKRQSQPGKFISELTGRLVTRICYLRATISWQTTEPQTLKWSRDGSLIVIVAFMGKCCYEQCSEGK